VTRAGVRVTVGAAKIELVLVALVGDQVRVSERGLSLGELSNGSVRVYAYRLADGK
jgi:hypothetical protein